MRKPVDRLALLVIPLLLVVFWLRASDARGPFYLGLNSDPEYCYLFNSLNLVTLHVPRHIDHPGTTLQELGAAVLLVRFAAARLGGDPESLEVAVVRQPEPLLFAINVMLNFLLIGLLAALSWRVWSLTGSLIPPLVLQFSFLAYGLLLAAQTRVSPEPLLVSTVLALALVLAPGIVGSPGDQALGGRRTALLAGAILGFGVITKVTFVPLLLLIFVFPGRRQRVRCAVAALVSAAVFVLPIFTQLPRAATWLFRLATHQGLYGRGPAGLPDGSTYLSSLLWLYGVEPFLFWSLAFFIAVAAFWRFGPPLTGGTLPSTVRRSLTAGIAVIVATIVITAKHPASQYLVPAVAMAPILSMMLADRLRRRWQPAAIRVPAAVGGVVLILAGVVSAGERKIETLRSVRNYRTAVTAQLHEIERRPDCTVVGVYRSSLPSSALVLGNDFSNGVHAAALERFYPGRIHYNRFIGRFRDWIWTNENSGVRDFVNHGGCLLLQGQTSDTDLETQYRFETIATSPWEQLVQLHPLSSEPPSFDRHRAKR